MPKHKKKQRNSIGSSNGHFSNRSNDNNQRPTRDTEKSTAPTTSTANNVAPFVLPGYHYDPVKNRYFKIMPGEYNPAETFVTKESIEMKRAEKERQAKLKEFAEPAKRRETQIQNLAHQRKKTLNMVELLNQRSFGFMSNLQHERASSLSSIKSMRHRGKCNLVDMNIDIMLADPKGKYLACTGNEASWPCLYVLQLSDHKVLDEERNIEFNLRRQYSILERNIEFSLRTEYSFLVRKSVDRVCWAEMKDDSQSLLFLKNRESVDLITLRCESNSDNRENGIRWTTKFSNRMPFVCAWSNRECVAVGMERRAQLFDLHGNKWFLNTDRSDVLAQTFNEDGSLLYNGTRSGRILVHDVAKSVNRYAVMELLEEKKAICKSRGSSPICSVVPLKQNESQIISSDYSGRIRLWDVRTKGVVQTYKGHINSYSDIPCHVNEEADLVYSVGYDNYIRMWQLSTGELLRTIPPVHPPSFPHKVSTTAQYSSNFGTGCPTLLVSSRHEIHAYSM